MLKYIIKRLLMVIPVLLFIIFIVFFILNITPGDPAQLLLGRDAPPEAVQKLREDFGLNKPFLARYVDYVTSVARLNFGKSYRTNKPVYDEILSRFPFTVQIALISVLVSLILGIPMGILSAVKRYSGIDITLTVTSLLLASVPGFWLALMMILIFAGMLMWLPSSGVGTWKNLVMPVLTLALPSAAFLARMTRTTMSEAMRQDYIRTAKAKGASNTRIIWRHALQNALMPVVTVVGMSFAGLMGGAMIAEIVFGLPGIGALILQAIQMKDAPTVMACTILLATLFMLIMLVVDIIYAYLDPRVKAQFK